MRKSLIVAMTCLSVATAARAQTPSADEAAVRAVAAGFATALAAGDSSAAIALLHPDVVIFEGGAWESLSDYRRGHLAADMRALQGLKQETQRDIVTLSGDFALITRAYSTSGTVGERVVDSAGAESMVLLRTPDGWKIRHIHWSSRPRRRPTG
jgi:ketosteroid isomerase-like protein